MNEMKEALFEERAEAALELWIKFVSSDWHEAARVIIAVKDYANKLERKLAEYKYQVSRDPIKRSVDEMIWAERLQQELDDVRKELDDFCDVFHGLVPDSEYIGETEGAAAYEKTKVLVTDGHGGWRELL